MQKKKAIVPEDMYLGYARWYFDRHPKEFKKLSKPLRAEFLSLISGLLEGCYDKCKLSSPIDHFRPNLAQGKLIYSLNKNGQMPRTMMLEGANK